MYSWCSSCAISCFQRWIDLLRNNVWWLCRLLSLYHLGDEHYIHMKWYLKNAPKWLKMLFTLFISIWNECGNVFWCWGVKVKLKSTNVPFKQIHFHRMVDSSVSIFFFFAFVPSFFSLSFPLIPERVFEWICNRC